MGERLRWQDAIGFAGGMISFLVYLCTCAGLQMIHYSFKCWGDLCVGRRSVLPDWWAFFLFFLLGVRAPDTEIVQGFAVTEQKNHFAVQD